MSSAGAARTGRATQWIRVVVTAVLLAVAIPHLEMPTVPAAARSHVWWWLSAALLVSAAGVILSAWRWQWVLRAMDAPLRLRQLVGDYFAGQFVSNFLPSTVGGDVVRVSRVSSSTGSGAVSFASVVIERLSGWVALPLLMLIGLAIDADLRALGTATAVATALAIGTLVALGLVIYAAGHQRITGRFARSESWTRFLGAIHLGVRGLSDHPRSVVGLLGAAVAYQLTTVTTVYVAAHALGVDLPVAAALVFAPAVAMIQVLPISFNGLGVREGAFVLFLGPLGVSTSQAVGIGLLVYGVTVVVSLMGAPAFATGPQARRARA